MMTSVSNAPRALSALLAITLATISTQVYSAITPYSLDFESIDPAGAPPNSMGAEGWFFRGLVSSPTGALLYGYTVGAAHVPPPAFAFFRIVSGEGGVNQGAQQISIFSDYLNADAHSNGLFIDSSIYRDQGVVTTEDIGKTVVLGFDQKRGDIQAPSTARAFIEIINFSTFQQLGIQNVDTTTISTDWTSNSVSLTIAPEHVGAHLLFGFSNETTSYGFTANFYDNIDFSVISEVPVPPALWLFSSGLLGLMGVARRTI